MASIYYVGQHDPRVWHILFFLDQAWTAHSIEHLLCARRCLMNVISILITVKLNFSALPKVMYLVSHRKESTEVLDGHFSPRWWTSRDIQYNGQLSRPCHCLLSSTFSLFCLFTDAPAPSPVSELAPRPPSSPGCSLRREETSEASCGFLWSPTLHLC